MYLRSCLSIRNVLLKKENMTPEDRSLVMKSKCGQEGRSVLVCCPLVRKLTGRFDAPVELPPPGECGKMQMDRIVGGEVAPIDGYPWLTRIQYYKGKAEWCRKMLLGSNTVFPSFVRRLQAATGMDSTVEEY